ncbi:C4-dicarboxylate transporter DcuC [Plebeiibacterium sediminum]|uniref:C4-dicarboxylate transporter DcuC n=1 Tax=Plebeiibacterium sediminum TaxID=2992112 RepID=A0AAE3M7C3_9BACT|nr:C4-dicarboxylate transporter DcuC [Plebeiobacterium sediminum]MCW3788165.1 C4-dicarboxylate transporter DcuC [Plebeiobacterium sediminum]
MLIIGSVISILIVVVVAKLLIKKYNPQSVLIISGLLMMAIALILGMDMSTMKEPTGWHFFDLFNQIKVSLSNKGAKVGLMIMTIGGYVAYMKKIGASEALVYASMKPLSIFRKYPYLAASIVIPIGQVLFMCIPSATGLGLLLVASIFPVLVNLGISKTSAVSVITACTVFDMGPASANTARASELIGKTNVQYFMEDQLPLTIPMTMVLMISYYFVNRYFDKKENHKPTQLEIDAFKKINTPKIYSILPMLPLIMLIIFSPFFNLFPTPIHLDTTTAMIISLFVSMVFEIIRKRNLKEVFDSIKTFWEGMGKVFASVITLIISAEIFSLGLINLGFVDGLIAGSQSLGFSPVGIGIVMSVLIFMASILMGSGNASFFSFGPLVPEIAAKMGIEGARIILPMQLSSSLGRAISPIAGVIIATSEIAGIKPYALAKRNLIPLSVTAVMMIVVHYIF